MKLGIIFLMGIISLFFSCKKSANNPIPSVPFDITINTSLPSYNSLQGVGGWTYVSGGVQGIVVYRKSSDEFVAFDRQSPAQQTACKKPLTTNSDNFLQLDDSCTNAKFSLFDGSPISGSEFGLRQYQTQWNGSSALRIFN
jgi:hypothetical protein